MVISNPLHRISLSIVMIPPLNSVTAKQSLVASLPTSSAMGGGASFLRAWKKGPVRVPQIIIHYSGCYIFRIFHNAIGWFRMRSTINASWKSSSGRYSWRWKASINAVSSGSKTDIRREGFHLIYFINYYSLLLLELGVIMGFDTLFIVKTPEYPSLSEGKFFSVLWEALLRLTSASSRMAPSVSYPWIQPGIIRDIYL